MEQTSEQEQLVWNLSQKVTEIIESEIGRGPWFDGHCRSLFGMLRSAKKLGLIPNEVSTSSNDVRTFTKTVRAWKKTKTPAQMRAAITENLAERNMPKGMCDLMELGHASE